MNIEKVHGAGFDEAYNTDNSILTSTSKFSGQITESATWSKEDSPLTLADLEINIEVIEKVETTNVTVAINKQTNYITAWGLLVNLRSEDHSLKVTPECVKYHDGQKLEAANTYPRLKNSPESAILILNCCFNDDGISVIAKIQREGIKNAKLFRALVGNQLTYLLAPHDDKT